jgi:hypothetical protein
MCIYYAIHRIWIYPRLVDDMFLIDLYLIIIGVYVSTAMWLSLSCNNLSTFGCWAVTSFWQSFSRVVNRAGSKTQHMKSNHLSAAVEGFPLIEYYYTIWYQIAASLLYRWINKQLPISTRRYKHLRTVITSSRIGTSCKTSDKIKQQKLCEYKLRHCIIGNENFKQVTSVQKCTILSRSLSADGKLPQKTLTNVLLFLILNTQKKLAEHCIVPIQYIWKCSLMCNWWTRRSMIFGIHFWFVVFGHGDIDGFER